ncbi:MAG: ATP-dependent Clp protease adaptor ClpS, partial [Gammaproteobacteria bacterium]|nr:ATP-dependent Clp protease adaptor ClpS [Gammaproteobacteria bacterium]
MAGQEMEPKQGDELDLQEASTPLKEPVRYQVILLNDDFTP